VVRLRAVRSRPEESSSIELNGKSPGDQNGNGDGHGGMLFEEFHAVLFSYVEKVIRVISLPLKVADGC
jgi:hypothetical protein